MNTIYHLWKCYYLCDGSDLAGKLTHPTGGHGKLILAVLLLLCLFNMPYGFYTLVRFAAMAAFGYLAYEKFKENDNGKGTLFVALAFLSNLLSK
jgi:hypothetical protein